MKMFLSMTHTNLPPDSSPSHLSLFLDRGEKITSQYVKVIAVVDPILPFFEAIFVQLVLLISTDILRPQYGSWNGCFYYREGIS